MGSEPHTRRPRVVILLGYDQDPVRWRQSHAAGETLDETPYGYERAQEWCDLVWARSHPESRMATRVRRAIAARLGYDLVHAWRNRRLLRSADAVWTHTEREHLAVAALWMRRRPPVIAQTVWLWDTWPSLSMLRRRHLARLLRRHTVEVTLSPVNAAISRAAVPGRQVEFVPFGTRVAAVAEPSDPAPRARPMVLAPGNDIHRDWPLLRDVAETLPDIDFRVATGRASARALDWPQNAIVGPATVAELRELYAQCAVVAVPLRENAHASGITVCLEALGARKPLVASGVGGIDAYLDGCARLVVGGDDDAFARAIVAAVDDPARASGVEEISARGLTQEDYVRRFVRLTRSILNHEANAAVSALAPVPAP